MHAKEDEVGQTDRVVVLLPLLLDALDNVEEKSRKPEGNRLTFILSSTGVRKGNITEQERKETVPLVVNRLQLSKEGCSRMCAPRHSGRVGRVWVTRQEQLACQMTFFRYFWL